MILKVFICKIFFKTNIPIISIFINLHFGNINIIYLKHLGDDLMRKNVGDIDAYIRLVAGFSLLSRGIMKKSTTMTILASMKIAEGTTRF